MVTQIWEEALGRSRISTTDNFFEIGGHSLLATRVVSTINAAFDTAIGVKEIFLYPTIVEFGKFLDTVQKINNLPPITKAPTGSQALLSYAQERLWFVSLLGNGMEYNMPFVFNLVGPLDVAALSLSFRMLLERHQVLRTVIREKDGTGFQHLLDAAGWELSLDEISAEGAEKRILELLAQPFDLSSDYMLRVRLLRLSATEYRLVLSSTTSPLMAGRYRC